MEYFREINRFKAVSENGDEFIIVEFHVVYRKDSGFPIESERKCYETSESDPVNQLDENSFQNVITGEILKRI